MMATLNSQLILKKKNTPQLESAKHDTIFPEESAIVQVLIELRVC